VRAQLRDMNLDHLNDRARRIPIASRISSERKLRSTGLPSSSDCADHDNSPESSHCAGSRVAVMNIQIRGTHKAAEVFGSLAGSKRNSDTNRTNQINSAMEGVMAAMRSQ